MCNIYDVDGILLKELNIKLCIILHSCFIGKNTRTLKQISFEKIYKVIYTFIKNTENNQCTLLSLSVVMILSHTFSLRKWSYIIYIFIYVCYYYYAYWFI